MSHPPAAPIRWYTHGWNRDLSWRLIHAVIPRVPRPLRPPIHLATTLMCFAVMPRERRAARRNLERVTGRRGPASLLAAFRLFYNFSKFMVAYTDLPPFRPRLPEDRVEGRDAARRSIETLLAEGRGLVVVTLHLGHWEMGLALLAGMDRPVSVVIRPEDGGGSRFEAAVRGRPGLRVVEAGEAVWNGLDLLLALRRGEVVAVQGDRPFGPGRRRATLFGAPAELPLGPLRLAQASGAPLLLVCLPIRGHGGYRLHVDGPVRVGAGPAGLAAGFDELTRRIEAVIAAHPTQWFNFYDVWTPEGDAASSRSSA